MRLAKLNLCVFYFRSHCHRCHRCHPSRNSHLGQVNKLSSPPPRRPQVYLRLNPQRLSLRLQRRRESSNRHHQSPSHTLKASNERRKLSCIINIGRSRCRRASERKLKSICRTRANTPPSIESIGEAKNRFSMLTRASKKKKLSRSRLASFAN
jgi:hypothetical protein